MSKLSYLKVVRPMYLSWMYISPLGPPVMECWAKVKSIVEHVLVTYPLLSLFIAGDFNSRLGSSNSSLVKFLKWDPKEMIPPWLCSEGKSRDSLINDIATLMVDLCTSYNLYILNGSPGSATAGDFTFFSPKGTSMVDYILISPDLLPKTCNFTIGVRTDSDHLPVQM